jgi:3-methylcrotonyl-CoA carboxylase alpha subunit
VAERVTEKRKVKIRGFDPWDAQDGFRLLGGARETIEFIVDEKRVPVTITYVKGGALKIEIAGEQVSDFAERPVGIARLVSGDIAVMKDGDTWLLSLYDPFAAAEAHGAASDRLIAPMSGKIVQLLVEPNAQVKRGQALAVLEAMKMEQTLSAPADAQVASVDVTAGEQVAEGAVILRFVVAQNAAS